MFKLIIATSAAALIVSSPAWAQSTVPGATRNPALNDNASTPPGASSNIDVDTPTGSPQRGGGSSTGGISGGSGTQKESGGG